MARPDSQASTRYRPLIACALLYLLLSLLWFAPVLRHPSQTVLGDTQSDVWKHVWTHWHLRNTLQDPAITLSHTSYLFAPEGGYLFDVNLFNGLLGLLLWWDRSLLLTVNVVLLAQLLAAAGSAFLLIRHITGGYAGALFGGIVYAFSPFFLGFAIASGVHERVAGCMLPLLTLFLIRIVQEGKIRHFAAFLLTAGAGAFACNNYLIFFAVAALFILLACGFSLLWKGRFRDLRFAILRLLVLLPLILVCLIPFYYQFRGMRQVDNITPKIIRMFGSWHLQTLDVRPLSTYFFAPDPELHTTRFQDLLVKNPHVNWVALALSLGACLFAVSRRRMAGGILLLAAVFLVLSLGITPILTPQQTPDLNRTQSSTDPAWLYPFTIPARILLVAFPFYNVINGIWQQVLVTNLALAVGAALCLEQIKSKRRRWLLTAGAILACQLETIFLSGIPVPLPTASPKVPAPYQFVLRSPPDQLVLDVPIFRDQSTLVPGEYYYYQTVHHHPIPYGINPWEDACSDLHRFFCKHWHCRNRSPDRSDDFTVFSNQIRKLGIQWICVHRRLLPDDQQSIEDIETPLLNTYGPPIYADSDYLLFRVLQ